jgi:hypothetical protein
MTVVTSTAVRVLITLGSSSTQGAGASSVHKRYTNLMAHALGAQLLNVGSGGQTVEQVRSTHLADVLAALKDAPVDGKIDLVTFLPYTDFANKQAPQIVTGYAPVLDALERTHAWVVFGIPTVDARSVCGKPGPRGPADYAEKEAQMRSEVTRHARSVVAEIPQMQVQHPEWIRPDGHPTDEGHAFVARSFLHAIAVNVVG